MMATSTMSIRWIVIWARLATARGPVNRQNPRAVALPTPEPPVTGLRAWALAPFALAPFALAPFALAPCALDPCALDPCALDPCAPPPFMVAACTPGPGAPAGRWLRRI